MQYIIPLNNQPYATPKSHWDPRRTLKELFQRYALEVSPKKRGMRWEQIRIDRICREDGELVNKCLGDLVPPDLVAWREKRLSQVSAASVNREMNLLSNAFNIAKNEWHWIIESPLKGVKRPSPGLPRERLFVGNELEIMTDATGYCFGKRPDTITARVGAAIHFAIETAMRAGEICNLDWKDVYLQERYAKLQQTKNGTTRKVPLSKRAIHILMDMESLRPLFNGKVFGMNTSQLDALFRKARAKTAIENLHFHDTRHEAITRLAKKLRILDLQRMVGIRDVRILSIYYNEPEEAIAKLLD